MAGFHYFDATKILTEFAVRQQAASYSLLQKLMIHLQTQIFVLQKLILVITEPDAAKVKFRVKLLRVVVY